MWIILGRHDESGAVVDKIDVSVDYGRTFSPMPGAGYTREAITIAGVPGEIVRSDNSDQVIVEYQSGEQVVKVTANAGDDRQMPTPSTTQGSPRSSPSRWMCRLLGEVIGTSEIAGPRASNASDTIASPSPRMSLATVKGLPATALARL